MNLDDKPITAMAFLSWGGHPPEWVKKLALFCDAHSQSEAARKIGRSASLINQVLKNRYEGSLKDVEKRVEAAFTQDGVACPVIGRISGSQCLAQQKKPYNPGNHIAVRLFRACRSCQHNISTKGEPHA